MKQIHIICKGRVQGVFFRARTRDKAVDLGIKGWVKNLDNGDVEVLAQGTEAQLAQLIGYCNKGPDIARVDNVEIKQEEIKKEYEDFIILA